MAFANEYILEADYEKYGLHEVDEQHPPTGLLMGHANSRSWTIDRDREMYLRAFSNPTCLEDSEKTGWSFYWQGELFLFLREGIASGGTRNGPQWSHFKIRQLAIPQYLRANQPEILASIEEAFRTHAGGGVLSNATEYSVRIEFELE